VEEMIRRSLLAGAARYREESPLLAALVGGLAGAGAPGARAENAATRGAGTPVSPPLLALYRRLFRILSTDLVEVPLLAGALHHIALRGEAPGLARFFPSCGGRLAPGEEAALVAASEEVLADRSGEVLDFLLSRRPLRDDLAPALLLLLGAREVTALFGGGLSLVEAGAGGGLRLLFDRYAYRVGAQRFGDSPVVLEAGIESGGDPGAEVLPGFPAVVGRAGLDPEPRDLTKPEQRLLVESFLPPDRPDRIDRLRAAAGLLGEFHPAERPEIKEGGAERLPDLLWDAYERMPPGNTLLLAHLFSWAPLRDGEQKATAGAVLALADRLKPEKPLAWLQADYLGPGGRPAVRLQTFHWRHPEERTAGLLGESDPAISRIRWQGGYAAGR
jgi:hypothetical protein